METTLIAGPMLSVIGITTVFVVLVCLVSVVKLMGRFLGGVGTTAPEAATPLTPAAVETETQGDEPAEPDQDLLKVALATYAYHRSRRANTSVTPERNEWSRVGRARQIASFRR